MVELQVSISSCRPAATGVPESMPRGHLFERDGSAAARSAPVFDQGHVHLSISMLTSGKDACQFPLHAGVALSASRAEP